MGRRPSGPGLAKVRKVQAESRRTVQLVSLREGWLATLVERADIVSEGQTVEEDGERTYYGSTSLRLAVSRDEVSDAERFVALLLADPHARLRLLRIAHREAATRADGSLDVLSADLAATVRPADDSVAEISIDIDVSAALLSRGAV